MVLQALALGPAVGLLPLPIGGLVTQQQPQDSMSALSLGMRCMHALCGLRDGFRGAIWTTNHASETCEAIEFLVRMQGRR